MCDLTWHICIDCQAEFRCDQHNALCPTFNGYDERCFNCEFNEEEIRRQEEREAQRQWEREEWERQFGYKE